MRLLGLWWQVLLDESGLPQGPHFADLESRFAGLVVNAFKLLELVTAVFVFQWFPFLKR